MDATTMQFCRSEMHASNGHKRAPIEIQRSSPQSRAPFLVHCNCSSTPFSTCSSPPIVPPWAAFRVEFVFRSRFSARVAVQVQRQHFWVPALLERFPHDRLSRKHEAARATRAERRVDRGSRAQKTTNTISAGRCMRHVTREKIPGLCKSNRSPRNSNPVAATRKPSAGI